MNPLETGPVGRQFDRELQHVIGAVFGQSAGAMPHTDEIAAWARRDGVPDRPPAYPAVAV
jgi:hypothetical protein